ncbi:low density lipoprotein receptor adapter protein 1-A [Leptinotarsa decemlineata]|uniref:low density lipoprotein receptor adapter protein 1-A n=1 Tax=Leptinotarsa decemlineata TaxID=7539 RepID=UPI003D306F3A
MAFLKTIWKANSKHEKLSEELALQNSKETETEQTQIIDAENEVVTFKLKYLGSTAVDKILGTNVSTEAVKNIIKTTKAKGRKKLQRVIVSISLQGIAVTDMEGNDILKISIYRISNCSTDPTHRQIFSFISTDPDKTSECHAFLCPRRKVTETVTLAVAHAFTTAYETWRQQPQTINNSTKNNIQTQENIINDLNKANAIIKNVEEEKLIDFDDEEPFNEYDLFCIDKPPNQNNVSTHWVSFDDDFSPSGTSPKETRRSEFAFA